MFLSVITPTYQRRHTLTRLYNSLTEQSDGDLEWIVVDDGSTDGTGELIEGFIREGLIKIKYFYQENSGKPTAHNKGVELALGELTVCVDSDDALTPDAVSSVRAALDESNERDIIGVIAKRRGFLSDSSLCSDFPSEIKSSRMTELTDKYGFFGDTALFFVTEVLKKHTFPKFENESFIPEDALYAELDESGKMLILDKSVYLCEYLPDGLTRSFGELLRANPMGTAYSYYRRLLSAHSFLKKLKYGIVSESYLKLSGRRAEYNRDKGKFILAISRLAVPFYMKKKGLVL